MKQFTFCLSFIFSSLVAFPNGGPIDGIFAQIQGGIKMLNQSEIELTRENLNIKVYLNYFDVEVIYYLKNHGQSNLVSYGFPVDLSPYQNENEEDYVEGFSFTFNDEKLSYDNKLERGVQSEYVVAFGGKSYTCSELSRNWYLTELEFEANSEAVLKVNYTITANYENYNGGGMTYFSYYSDRSFIYDVKPAGFWGDGIVDQLNITIDTWIDISEEEIVIRGFDNFQIQDGVYTKTISDFKPKAYEPLFIAVDMSSLLNYDEVKRSLPSSVVKNIRCSSQLVGNYSPHNLIDDDKNTAWVEGVKGAGIGEWIEVEFIDGVLIEAVTFLNGYTKSKGTYITNNKVKSYKIDVTIEQGDSVIVEEFYKENEIPLTDRSLRPMKYRSNYYSMLDIILDNGEWCLSYPTLEECIAESGKIKKIRFTITDVYKGTKYDDICISEMKFYGSFMNSN
ncbi:NADase-type glycan-binding domain-containing protein [Sediminitomix flava]|uniref:NAD glycohydrolase translocation F5/8 type C domain-containing protein n=1 Tax=Sediminitomix flava TaxID=379075 RepID=A0A315ZH72_SEDFL|nr:hypothetical protein [Sediminitomix flava]PWJ44198.1 hypothetical protein BC781_101548 [Sediminitomix flava]